MSDRPSTPEEPEIPQGEPEPEGGPLGRERDFLEERFSDLRPKEEVEKGVPGGPPGPLRFALGEAAEGEAPEEEPPAPSRRRLIEQYRRRQRAKRKLENEEDDLEEEEEAGEEGAAPGGLMGAAPGEPEAPPSEAPPEPPQAPPANNWTPIGPSVLRQGQGGVKPATSGRTPAIVVAPGGQRIYIGSANGGVWRSDDGGLTWRSLMEAFDLNPTHRASDSLAVGAIAIDLADPDRVYVGSGEGAGGAYFGVGPIYSDDGGLNWITEPVAPGSPPLAGSAFYALAVDPADPERVVAATRQGLYRREPDGSGGFHWAKKPPGANTWVTSAVAAHSGGVTTFYAAAMGGPVYASNDGHTWDTVGSNFPSGVGRISLAVQADNPDLVYALTSLGTVYRLDRQDGTWRQIAGVPPNLVGSQGWYDLAIAVAPDNPNRLYLGGSTIFSGGDWSGSVFRCEIQVSGPSVSMTPTYIGNSVHADIHALVFVPGDPDQLWLGCDGGVFYSNNPTGSGDIFEARNAGLSTLTMNYLGQHPREEAVVFCGTQDNGCVRYTGEEAWLYSAGGDGGFVIVNWFDPFKILSTYVRGTIRRSLNGGARYSYFNASVPLATNQMGQPIEPVLFYAPIAGTPVNYGQPAEADRVAFGSIRPWISDNFGDSWQSIPTGTLEGDRLDERIRALTFASAARLYAGTLAGGVYRFDHVDGAWIRTRLDDLGGSNRLPLAGPVTDIAVDPADPSGSSIYITFGGGGDYRHVWHFDGSGWQARSGPGEGDLNSLLDVQANAIAVDPSEPGHVYLGADIGVWRSINGGQTWAPFSEGLPDAAVLDLALHAERRLLRASTHGRGVYERSLDGQPRSGVELYVRSTQLDTGRSPAVNGLPNPCAFGEPVWHWRGPDIKLDTPDADGRYQIPPGAAPGFLPFCDTLSDDPRQAAMVPTHEVVTHVYVQVHNRGVIPADEVRVMLLAAQAAAGLPPLPAGYEIQVQNGLTIDSDHWKTVGFATLTDLRAGSPRIACFELTREHLPPPAGDLGDNHPCVLALVHHPQDPYASAETRADRLTLAERKAAQKNFSVVQFAGPAGSAPPVFVPIRINNPSFDQDLCTTLVLQLGGYPGRARLHLPALELQEPLQDSLRGMLVGQDMTAFEQWAEEHIAQVQANLESDQPYNPDWAGQRLEDLRQALEAGLVLEIEDKFGAALSGIRIPAGGGCAVFLALDHPGGETGQHYPLEIIQWDEDLQELSGGLSLRVELVPEPVMPGFSLLLEAQQTFHGYRILARLSDPNKLKLSPEEQAQVRLSVRRGDSPAQDLGPMKWHRAWKAYYTYARLLPEPGISVTARAQVGGRRVAEVKQILPGPVTN